MRRFEIPARARLRFLDKVDMSGDCWEWMGTPNKDGYGSFKCNGKMYLAHRIAFVLEFGQLDDRLCICHTCDNTLCVNPRHLWMGTNGENQQDKASKGRVVGELNPRAKVSNRQMQEIRNRFTQGESVKRLAAEFNYSRHHLYKMLRGDQWKVNA
jgi:hypothetical protein